MIGLVRLILEPSVDFCLCCSGLDFKLFQYFINFHRRSHVDVHLHLFTLFIAEFLLKIADDCFANIRGFVSSLLANIAFVVFEFISIMTVDEDSTTSVTWADSFIWCDKIKRNK